MTPTPLLFSAMHGESVARAANRAWDREPDHFVAGLIADYANMSCRDQDRTIAEMTDAEIEALVSNPSPTAAGSLEAPVVNSHGSQAASAPGREFTR